MCELAPSHCASRNGRMALNQVLAGKVRSSTITRARCEGIVSKRLAHSPGRRIGPLGLKVNNPAALAAEREAEEECRR